MAIALFLCKTAKQTIDANNSIYALHNNVVLLTLHSAQWTQVDILSTKYQFRLFSIVFMD